jgi:hypothetical protein
MASLVTVHARTPITFKVLDMPSSTLVSVRPPVTFTDAPRVQARSETHSTMPKNVVLALVLAGVATIVITVSLLYIHCVMRERKAKSKQQKPSEVQLRSLDGVYAVDQNFLNSLSRLPTLPRVYGLGIRFADVLSSVTGVPDAHVRPRPEGSIFTAVDRDVEHIAGEFQPSSNGRPISEVSDTNFDVHQLAGGYHPADHLNSVNPGRYGSVQILSPYHGSIHETQAMHFLVVPSVAVDASRIKLPPSPLQIVASVAVDASRIMLPLSPLPSSPFVVGDGEDEDGDFEQIDL